MTDTVDFTVTRGNPSDEELAAMVVALTAMAAQDQDEPGRARVWSPHWVPYRAPGTWTPFTHIHVGV